MSKKRAKHLRDQKKELEYLYVLAGHMGLSHWDLTISHRPCAAGHWAEVNAEFTLGHASVRLAKTWDELPAEERRATLVHELLHVHTSGPFEVFELCTEDMPARARQISERAWRLCEERMVEDIARRWAIHLPLPEEHIDAG